MKYLFIILSVFLFVSCQNMEKEENVLLETVENANMSLQNRIYFNMAQLEYLSEWADDSVNYHRYKTGAGFYKLVLDMLGSFDDNLVFIEEDTLNTDQIVSSFNSMRDYLANFA